MNPADRRKAAARAMLHARVVEETPGSLKALLASAPLEDIDLTRPRDPGNQLATR